MIILCPGPAVPALSVYGKCIGLSGFPSLNNEGDIICLTSPEGRMVHAIEYNISWYRNEVKSEGGWTLEMIDAKNPCAGADNWKASTHASGGSPGSNNSVTGIQRDEKPPALLRTYTLDQNHLVAVFDEPLDSLSAAIIQHYQSSKGITIIEAIPLMPFMKEVKLKVSAAMARDTLYQLSVNNLSDCAGNVCTLHTVPMGLAAEAVNMDVVINELLFNPLPGGTDYIELHNRGSRTIDVSRLFIASRSASGQIVSPRKLSETNFLLFPSDYFVITDNALAVSEQYTSRHPSQIIVIGQMPSMPDDKGTVVLLNTRGEIIDELSYDEKWHFPLIVRPEGVALERIHPGLPSQSKYNWTSAASDAGYGTPTYRNSQARQLPPLPGQLEIEPKVFSPDNDGLDDWCLVRYELASAGYVANVTVFDTQGYAVRNLSRNMLLSDKGFIRWDGLGDAGERLPAGVYIILAELFNMGGKTMKFKNTVTLARAF